MKTKINPLRHGSLGTAEFEKIRPLGVQCTFCKSEVHYSLTAYHEGYPEISCLHCKRTGYLMRNAREGGKLIWFRTPQLATT